MPFQQRSRSPNSEAAEPLYRDSSDESEKHQSHGSDTQTQALQASIRQLRRWLIAVSIALAISCAYTLFSFRHVVRSHTTSKRLNFAPESVPLPINHSRTNTNPISQSQHNSPPSKRPSSPHPQPKKQTKPGATTSRHPATASCSSPIQQPSLSRPV